MNEKIRNAYHVSRNIYDQVLTAGNLFSRLYVKIFWNGTDDRQAAERLLKWIPDDFDGKILDAPCGTCMFTEEKWNHLKQAQITCPDYSIDMLKQAETRVHDVHFLQGDVSALPFENASFSLVVSMNGFHAFSDKQKAFMKIYRDIEMHTDGSIVYFQCVKI